jgi:hypothetical protein
MARVVTRADLMPMADYGKIRHAHRRKMVELKAHRRLLVGPFATFHFENYDTMWAQVHEMLFIEKGGADQIDGELAAYNPLVPRGCELVATMLIEIEDEIKRGRVLATLGHVEDAVTLGFGGETVRGAADADADRTTPEGKTSAVHFLHFPFTAGQIAKFRTPGTQVILGVGHANYGHMAVMPESTRVAISADFDE